MFTCTKKFGPFPFAHRQPSHEGHCAKIHGHNWYFEVTFLSNQLDQSGFVIDFGGEYVKVIKKDLEYFLDHTLVLNLEDPLMGLLRHNPEMADLRFVTSCSCEGLAFWAYDRINGYLKAKVPWVEVSEVTVHEDEKNSATYKAVCNHQTN